jgi:hypothetical protein
MKGIMPKTLALKQYEAADEVSVVLEVSHLRFWYMNLQPTYLAVYVGSADVFLVIDIKDWVRKHHGNEILTFPHKATTVKVHKRNMMDDNFFSRVIEKNLIPVLRGHFKKGDDREVTTFLRDSAIVKWLAGSRAADMECRIRVVTYGSKTRTEAYFETKGASGEWEIVRSHWQFMMGNITATFPYLDFYPKQKVIEKEVIEIIDDGDAEFEHRSTIIEFAEADESGDWLDDDDLDHDLLLPLREGEYSYGQGQFEMQEHLIRIELNSIGRRWSRTIDVLEAAEVLSVDMAQKWVSVAPWHARDI